MKRVDGGEIGRALGAGAVVPQGERTAARRLLPQKLMASGAAINRAPPGRKERTYLAKELVLACLPHSDPGNVPEWVRHNGPIVLKIRPHFNGDHPKYSGYPYGSVPRLLLFWLTTEVLKVRSREITLGGSLAEFVSKLGLWANSGGARGDSTRVMVQMQRLFRARFSVEHPQPGGRVQYEDMQIAPAGYYWWDPATAVPAEQGALFSSWIRLSQEFYEELTHLPVPVDVRALRALKRSPLALDLYAWCAYEAYKAREEGKARWESWEQLHGHLGGSYADLKDFARKVKEALVKIEAVYPGLRQGKRRGGIEILPSSTPAVERARE